MAYTKYSITPANNTAAPPDGAPEGMLPSAVNDTMRDMMAQIRDVGDGIRDGTYTMTAPKITGGTITGATFTGNTFSNPIITGVSTFAAGTVSAPAITTTGDTNTGIFFPAADTIAFTEGGAEAARFDSSGRLLIGTTSGTRKLTVYENAAQVDISIVSSTTGLSVIQMGDTAADNQGQIVYRNSDDAMTFGANGAERMRITSGGNLLVATTTVRNSGIVSVDFAGNSAGGMGINDTDSVNGGVYASFLSGGTFRGSITNNNNTAVAYNTTSDYRLKKNIAPMTGALSKVAQLKPCTYTWKETGSSSQGFIAHELAEVCPDAVTGEKDAINKDGSIKPQGVDTSFLVATLTAAIQEQQAMIEDLKSRIATLEAK